VLPGMPLKAAAQLTPAQQAALGSQLLAAAKAKVVDVVVCGEGIGLAVCGGSAQKRALVLECLNTFWQNN
jgi:hypothetical protein